MDRIDSPLPAAAARPRVPARLVLGSIAALWLTYLVLASLRGWLVGLELLDMLFWRRLLVTFASMAVTAALWPLLRLLDPRPAWLRVGAVMAIALPASLLLAAINQWAFASVESQVIAKIAEREGLRITRDEAGNLLVDPADRAAVPGGAALTLDAHAREETRLRQLIDTALGRYFLLLAWAGLYFALANAEQARGAERREGEYRRAAKAAELRSLRYQVNPHFLFNTLNSLSALVMAGRTAAAEQMIQTLSNFYRRSLAGDPTGDVRLEQEIELQAFYLEIEAVRFPDRLRVRIDLPAELADARVPGMILQPLIENAVKYAVAPVARVVTIAIAARAEAEVLVLEVVNDGPGLTTTLPGFGIGLANVRDRLAARFGAAADLHSGPLPVGGWLTTIRIPLETHG